MEGKISLKEFIEEVKADLRSAVNSNDPFFVMESVELEVSFGLDVSAKAGAKFVVFDLGAKTSAQQTHRVKINLTPFVAGSSTNLGAVFLRKAGSKNKVAKVPVAFAKPIAKSREVKKIAASKRANPTQKKAKTGA